MTKEDPFERPTLACLRNHPYFWSNEKILEFFVSISNRLELRDDNSNMARNFLQENCSEVIKGNWLNALDEMVKSTLPHRNRMNYNGHSVEELLRALRNKKNHYDDMTSAAKHILGPIPDRFTSYWIDKFPLLLLHVYKKFYKSGIHSEKNFASFYPNFQQCSARHK